ncbi:VWA domain-containing protein, partial [Bradyrhizobium uaiense]|uniref:VWA domain-containing protein n=1 Tax=Bradyrhizobium uaiense TaxID=2594946 RepID=UPI003D30FDB7
MAAPPRQPFCRFARQFSQRIAGGCLRNDGEVLRLGRMRRRQRPRKILFLIDVSGSMKARTEENMRLA